MTAEKIILISINLISELAALQETIQDNEIKQMLERQISSGAEKS